METLETLKVRLRVLKGQDPYNFSHVTQYAPLKPGRKVYKIHPRLRKKNARL